MTVNFIKQIVDNWLPQINPEDFAAKDTPASQVWSGLDA